MIYLNDRELMQQQKLLFNNETLTFMLPDEATTTYVISYGSLHKDLKDPWFIVTKIKRGNDNYHVLASKGSCISGARSLICFLIKLKKEGYQLVPNYMNRQEIERRYNYHVD